MRLTNSLQPLIALFIWVSIVYSSLQPAGFTTWFWQESVVANNWLYIDGGSVYIEKSQSQVNLNYTIAIDLSQSWTNSSIPAVITNKPASFPLARKPSLWYDAKSDLVYSMGGFQFSEIQGSTIWAFKPDGNGNAPWQKLVDETNQLWSRISPSFGGLTAISDNSFYSLSGAAPDPETIFQGQQINAYPGMAVFDYQSSQWTNISSSGYKPKGFGILGQAEFIPTFGKNGTIVFIGGDAPTVPSWSYCEGSSLTDMSTVTIYDIDSGDWLQQKTTGDIPPSRYAFCMVGAGESSAGSYELFVYGGLTHTEGGQEQTTDLFDFFLLSLPSFSWNRVSSRIPQMRASHKCQVIGNRQMLVIGGHDPSSLDFGSIQDVFANGLGIFDMSNLTWADKFDPGAGSYIRPSVINDYYAKNKSSPTWNSPQVSSIFATTVSTTPALTTPAPPSNPSKSSHHTPTGAIIGGVIGGVFAISIILLLSWCFTKRRQRQYNPPLTPELNRQQQYDPPLTPELKRQPAISTRSELAQPTGELEGGDRLHELESQYLMHAELDAHPMRPVLSDGDGR